MTIHDVPDTVNRLWTTTHEPVLHVQSGDELRFDVQEGGGGQFDSWRNGDPVPALDGDVLYPLAGPIMIEGAEPGDVVEIEYLDFQPKGWGWTAVLPGLGLLPEDFPEAALYRWDVSGAVADFKGVAAVPVRPFLGVTALTPDTIEPMPVGPPGLFGGNLDCRDLVAGSSLFLPVQTHGARLMFGDPHAAQGDGEVCISAIEASLSGALRVHLHPGRHMTGPRFRTAGPLRSGIDDGGYYATMGVADSLMQASKDAIRAMIDHLGSEYGLSPSDAYILCSVAVDLKISEIVDAPNWVVSAYLPTSIMVG